MRWAIMLVLLSCIGCASRSAREAPTTAHVYDESPATSLAFESPAMADAPRMDLWRDERTASAFVAFEDLTTTFLYIRTYDRLTTDGTDRYIRRAIIEKTGASYR